MASIGEVYGTDFQDRSVHDKAIYAAKLFATNIAHKQFSFNNDGSAMWKGYNMKPEIIEALLGSIPAINPQLRLTHISKTSPDINMFPYLINGAVEYFVLIDMSTSSKVQLYSIYITPTKMEAF